MIGLKDQCFGVEVEMTGITREQAATALAAYFATDARYVGGAYDKWCVTDRDGKEWTVMSDSSIHGEQKIGSGYRATGDYRYRVEMVTPKLTYAELPKLQECVRQVRHAGAKANSSCGIHVHVDGANHTPESLSRLLNFATGRQDLFYESLQIGERADQWCHKINPELFKAMKKQGRSSRTAAEEIWYSSVNDGYSGGISHEHYNRTRYHGINLHAFFTKGTVEFRLFNGTTHAGRIKAYIQFCLAMSAWSINCDHDNLHFKSIAGYTQQQKHDLMMRVLTKRLGMRGPEFKTARLHLTAAFEAAPAVTAA